MINFNKMSPAEYARANKLIEKAARALCRCKGDENTIRHKVGKEWAALGWPSLKSFVDNTWSSYKREAIAVLEAVGVFK